MRSGDLNLLLIPAKRSLGQSNVLHPSVILFTGEGLCPWSHVPSRSLCQEGVSVQRGLYLAISVQEFSVQDRVLVRRGSLSGFPVQGGQGNLFWGDLCQEGVSVNRGSLSGVPVQGSPCMGIYVRRGSLSGGSLSGGGVCKDPPSRNYGGRSGGTLLSGMLSSVKTILHYCYRSVTEVGGFEPCIHVATFLHKRVFTANKKWALMYKFISNARIIHK